MRLFAAIHVPETVKDKMLDVSEKISMRGITLVKREALHVTVAFFGDADESSVKDAISDAIEGMKAFDVSISKIGFFDPKQMKIIYAGISEGRENISKINEKIVRSMNIDDRKFIPHVTLGRIKADVDTELLKRKIAPHMNEEFGKFEVEGISLMNSRLTENGPTYERLWEGKF